VSHLRLARWESRHGRVYREESSGSRRGGSRVIHTGAWSIARGPEGRADLVAAVRVVASLARGDGHAQVGHPLRRLARLTTVSMGHGGQAKQASHGRQEHEGQATQDQADSPVPAPTRRVVRLARGFGVGTLLAVARNGPSVGTGSGSNLSSLILQAFITVGVSHVGGLGAALYVARVLGSCSTDRALAPLGSLGP
jgi:hypothetical protein